MTPTIATRDDWLKSRLALLEREKAHTRERDALAAARHALPWVKVERDYLFDGPEGRETLADLFAGRTQLLVYHFMFGPDWDEGCPSCSFWADNMDGIGIHLAHRDTTLVMASSAPYEKLEAYRARMGWRLKWVSAVGPDFNRDMHVTFTPEEVENREGVYNYRKGGFGGLEAPGISAFRREGGAVYHTYSAYARGLEGFNAAYQLLDLTSKGRDEAGLPFTMAWLRRRDRYED